MKNSVCRFLFSSSYLREGTSNSFKCMKVAMVTSTIGSARAVHVHSVPCFDRSRDNPHANS